MPVRAWTVAGVIGLGLGLAVLGGTPPWKFEFPLQTIIAAPYVLFALLAACSASPTRALFLAGACIVLHAGLLLGLANDASGGEGAWATVVLFAVMGPGLLALVALGLLGSRWVATRSRTPNRRPRRAPPR